MQNERRGVRAASVAGCLDGRDKDGDNFVCFGHKVLHPLPRDAFRAHEHFKPVLRFVQFLERRRPTLRSLTLTLSSFLILRSFCIHCAAPTLSGSLSDPLPPCGRPSSIAGAERIWSSMRGGSCNTKD